MAPAERTDNNEEHYIISDKVDRFLHSNESGEDIHKMIIELIGRYLKEFPEKIPTVLREVYLAADSAQRRQVRNEIVGGEENEK